MWRSINIRMPKIYSRQNLAKLEFSRATFSVVTLFRIKLNYVLTKRRSKMWRLEHGDKSISPVLCTWTASRGKSIDSSRMYLSRARREGHKVVRWRDKYIDNIGPPFIAPGAFDTTKPLAVHLDVVSRSVGLTSLNNILIDIIVQ